MLLQLLDEILEVEIEEDRTTCAALRIPTAGVEDFPIYVHAGDAEELRQPHDVLQGYF